ncbi:MAG: HTH domain-containing protein [Anaerolineaceae bacterium]|nr:HTH domain-containing protein [Anaerolineaceae bacterium]
MLTKILERIRNTNGTITIRQLSQELNVEPTALEGIILQLSRMGKLEIVEDDVTEGGTNCKACIGCNGVADCPFIIKLLRSFRLK